MQKRSLLKGISGIFKAGEVSAIMGASGAGKTTLLNMVACRIHKNPEGHLFANTNQYTDQNFGDFANYVMQADVLLQTMTVRETLEFAAKLKLNLDEEERNIKINDLANKLKLNQCLDVLIGGLLLKGISGGERKRTSIAFELITNPQVIMLDQPTSGLDSLTSYVVIKHLCYLAHVEKKTIIMTIHQPNTEIFQSFDSLFLLVEGNIIYQGKASLAVDYFDKNFQLKCPQFHNPADYLMSIMHHQKPQNKGRFPNYIETYKKQLEQKVQNQIQLRHKEEIQTRIIDVPMSVSFGTLVKRDFLNIVRNPLLIKARLFQVIVLSIFIGGLFINVTKNGDYISLNSWRSLTGFLFFHLINMMMMAVVPVTLIFPVERQVFLKEQSARLYSVTSYFISRNLVQIPYQIIFPIVSSLIIYWFVGLSSTAAQFFIFLLITFLLSLAGNSLGLLIGSILTDAKSVGLILNFFVAPVFIFSGFYKNSGNLSGWIGWIQYLSPIKYSFSAYVHNQVMNASKSNIALMNFDLTLWPSIGILFALTIGFRMVSLFFYGSQNQNNSDFLTFQIFIFIFLFIFVSSIKLIIIAQLTTTKNINLTLMFLRLQKMDFIQMNKASSIRNLIQHCLQLLIL